MAAANTILGLLRSAAPTALVLFLIALFAGTALAGKNGVLAWRDYDDRLTAKRAELVALEAKKKVLANQVALLDPRRANPDMAEELVRRDLGLAHPDELILAID